MTFYLTSLLVIPEYQIDNKTVWTWVIALLEQQIDNNRRAPK